MIEYWDRLSAAMTAKSQRDKKPFDVTDLALAMGVSYQAVAKVKNGGSFGKDNNIKAARILEVSSDWLAAGSSLTPTAQRVSEFAGFVSEPKVQYLAEKRPSPSAVILQLAELLRSMDETDRKMVKPLLADLADNPEKAAQMASKFERMLGGIRDGETSGGQSSAA